MRRSAIRATAAFILALIALPVARAAVPAGGISAPHVVTGRPEKLAWADAPKATVVVFLSARCPCSASHEPVVAALARELVPQGVRFVGVHSNSDEPAKEAAGHFARAMLPFPVLSDEGARLADAFGALKTPHAYVVSPAGAVLYQGGVDDSQVAGNASRHFLREALEAVAAGRAPGQARARALGCVIRRS